MMVINHLITRMILQVAATLSGEYFGELALLTCAPRRATLRNSQVDGEEPAKLK